MQSTGLVVKEVKMHPFCYSTGDVAQYLWVVFFFAPRRYINTEKLNTLSLAREEIHHSSENTEMQLSPELLSMFLIGLNVYNHCVY